MSNVRSTKNYDCFVGREIAVDYSQHDLKGQKFDCYELANSDNVIAEIESIAAKNKESVRVWLPATAGTCDFRQDRLNVYVDEDDKGVFRVTGVKFG